MNLLTDQWIPVRPVAHSGPPEKISLRRLLCQEEKWEVCLPRDDMELAAVQLIVCLGQTLFTPKDAAELKQRVAKPLSEVEYDAVFMKPYCDWFRLDHPQFPFMQVRGLVASDITPMDKLLAGLTGATNSCFVNEPGLGERLCGGCSAIALFNQASCTPSFGGGFKASLRGSTPITTLIQGTHLRQTLWLNVLSEESLTEFLPTLTHEETASSKPTWAEPIRAGESIAVQRIGLLRGLLWQPAHVELLAANEAASCSCCGFWSGNTFTGFKKAKFNYNLAGTWPHPHSPRIMSAKKGKIEEKFAAFTTAAPSWTQLSRFVVRQQMNDTKTEGQQPAAVVLQIQKLYGGESERLHLLVGGYRNNQASVLERRHEVFTLNHGWDRNTHVIRDLVRQGLGYRDALVKALFVFANGLKDSKRSNAGKFKGAGVKLHQQAEVQYYRRSEPTIQEVLARIDFNNPEPELARMRESLGAVARDLFDESVRPYSHDPELIRTLAAARRTLHKHLRNIGPQKDIGGENGGENGATKA
jgi:CRISPR system Cascade subunit CasA